MVPFACSDAIFSKGITHCSRVIAACNSISALSTVIGSLLVEVLNILQMPIAWMWISLGILNGVLFLLTIRFFV